VSEVAVKALLVARPVDTFMRYGRMVGLSIRQAGNIEDAKTKAQRVYVQTISGFLPDAKVKEPVLTDLHLILVIEVRLGNIAYEDLPGLFRATGAGVSRERLDYLPYLETKRTCEPS
jgi:hypothetical protein